MFGTVINKKGINRNALEIVRKGRTSHAAGFSGLSTNPAYASKYLLKGFLSYLGSLYSQGEISQSAYYSLIDQAITLSVESMTVRTMENLLQKYEGYLESSIGESFSIKR